MSKLCQNEGPPGPLGPPYAPKVYGAPGPAAGDPRPRVSAAPERQDPGSAPPRERDPRLGKYNQEQRVSRREHVCPGLSHSIVRPMPLDSRLFGLEVRIMPGCAKSHAASHAWQHTAHAAHAALCEPSMSSMSRMTLSLKSAAATIPACEALSLPSGKEQGAISPVDSTCDRQR